MEAIRCSGGSAIGSAAIYTMVAMEQPKIVIDNYVRSSASLNTRLATGQKALNRVFIAMGHRDQIGPPMA
jgi:hypothetical protein